jgi:hypothetical protein
MRFVILLVVGIISISAGRVGSSLSAPPVNGSIAFGPFKNTVASVSFEQTAPSQPRDVRRDDAIEALFEPEENTDQGFDESRVSYPSAHSMKAVYFSASNMALSWILSNRPVDSGRSGLLRC